MISPGNYVYNGNGNISSVTMGGSTATYAYNSTCKRLTALGGAIVRSYAYDVYGSVSGDGEWSYGYDDVPNLKQITPAAEGRELMQFTPGVKVLVSPSVSVRESPS